MASRIALFLTAFVFVCGLPILFPGIDLWASALFYRAPSGFFLGDWPPFRLLHRGLPFLIIAIVIAASALLLATLALRRPILGVDRRAALFLLVSLAVGPGLTVNVVFKDHWGRARPAQLAQFGGDKQFTRAFVPSAQCNRNCSFPAGDPSIGFYLVSVAFLLPEARGRRVGIAGALGLGALIGLARLAQGGHFLSDVMASGFLVYATSWLAHRALLAHDGLTSLLRNLRHPSRNLKRFALFTIAAVGASVLAARFLDQPLARYFQDGDPTLRRIFTFITAFGDSTFYLAISAILAVGFHLARMRAADPARGRHFAANAWRAGFVFAAIAVPGLIGDILKPIFGRARPKLLFMDDASSFNWAGGGADYWSFPSGHTITIVGLAAALFLIYPRGLPLYVLAAALVAASRVVIDAHYLSDVLAGGFLAVAVVWVMAAACIRAGIPLESDAGRAPVSDSP